MSRGPGVLQRRVLEALGQYQLLGQPRPAIWDSAWSITREDRWLIGDDDWAAFAAGRYVPVRVLMRDLGCSGCDLSRALKSLEARALVVRYDKHFTDLTSDFTRPRGGPGPLGITASTLRSRLLASHG